jgi:tetratricopeptide (TPR) repeat protein
MGSNKQKPIQVPSDWWGRLLAFCESQWVRDSKPGDVFDIYQFTKISRRTFSTARESNEFKEATFNRLVAEIGCDGPDQLHQILSPPASATASPTAIQQSPPPDENIPKPLKKIFEEAGKLVEADRDEEAKAKYKTALTHPDAATFPQFRVKAKIGVASVLRRLDPDEARKLFRECLAELPDSAPDKLREDLFARMAELEVHSGHLLQAKAFVSEAQKIAARLGDNIKIACNLETLATLEDRSGRLNEAISLFDEAAELLVAEHQRQKSDTEKRALVALGICLTNKSFTHKRQGDLIGALSSLEQAVQWFRKGEIQDDHFARTLRYLAEAKFADEKWEDGLQTLQESLRNAMKREDYVGVCECLKLSGKLKFTFGDEEGALRDFSAALNLMREKGKPDQLLDYLDKVAHVAARHGLKAKARELLNEAKGIAQKEERLEDCADAVLDLADLEDGPHAKTKQKEALRTAIAYLETLLPKVEVKGRKAYLLGRIGVLYQRLGNLEDALTKFTLAKELYEKIGDAWGIVNSLGSIADVKRLQDKPDEEMNLYRCILTVAEGKPLGEFVARTKNNMGVRLMQTGFLRDAEQLLNEADELCRRKHIRELHAEVQRNLERVERLIEAHKPASMSFPDLFRELHELADFFPEAKESILRFWYHWRDIELHSNCRSLLGVKWLIAEDDTGKFLDLVGKLAIYSDLSLQVVATEYPGFGVDFVPWPKEKPTPDRVAKPVIGKINDADDSGLMAIRFVRGAIHWPYTETSDEAVSKTTGREGIILFGHARGLPPQAGELMFGQTVEDLVAKRIVFFPWNRSSKDSRLADDLSLAKEQSLIPLYAESLPGAEDVEETAHVSFLLPVVISTPSDKTRSQIAEVRRMLVRLLSLEDQEAVAGLNTLVGKLDDLHADSGVSESIRMTAYVLHFPVHGTLQTHFAFVHHAV